MVIFEYFKRCKEVFGGFLKSFLSGLKMVSVDYWAFLGIFNGVKRFLVDSLPFLRGLKMVSVDSRTVSEGFRWTLCHFWWFFSLNGSAEFVAIMKDLNLVEGFFRLRKHPSFRLGIDSIDQSKDRLLLK